jgi:hypothetical protein
VQTENIYLKRKSGIKNMGSNVDLFTDLEELRAEG